MNERIRELAKKSGFSLDSTGIYTAKLEHLPITENMEKFAELIIKECMDQCEKIRADALVQKKSEFLTNDGKMLYEGVYGGANNCGYAIQQHFGVK
jgi:transcriptional regulator of nitric oxide reductase